MKKNIVLLIIMVLVTGNIFAQTDTIKKEISNLKKRIEILEKTKDTVPKNEYEFVKSRYTDFEKFVKDERKSHQDFLQYSLSIAGIIVAAFLIIVGFLGFKTLKDARETYNREFKLFLDGEKLEAKKAYDAWKYEIFEDLENIKQKNDILDQELNTMLKFKNSQILFVNNTSEYQQVQNQIRSFLVKFGFNPKQLKAHSNLTDLSELQLRMKESNFLVYFYNPIDEKTGSADKEIIIKRDLKLVNDILPLVEKSNIPLIIYHPSNKGYLHTDDKAKLDKSDVPYVIANMPFTLYGQIVNTAQLV